MRLAFPPICPPDTERGGEGEKKEGGEREEGTGLKQSLCAKGTRLLYGNRWIGSPEDENIPV